MAHINDAILPITIRFGSSTTSELAAQQLRSASGYRKVNEIWDEPLRTFRLIYKHPIRDGILLTHFWEALGYDSFLLRDWTFWHTARSADSRPDGSAGIANTDAPLVNPNTNDNTADGSTTVFRTHVTRTAGSASRTHRIRHPASADLVCAFDGTDCTAQVSSVNEETGEVTFAQAPPFGGSPNDAVMTWGGTFYRAAHFTEGVEEVMNNFEANAFNLVLMEARGV